MPVPPLRETALKGNTLVGVGVSLEGYFSLTPTALCVLCYCY